MTEKPQLILATEKAHFSAGAELFMEYIRTLEFDIGFQQYQQEIEQIQELYSPPKGVLWLVYHQQRFEGCCAVRPFKGAICELKRTYLRPALHARGLGQVLLDKCMSSARGLGYQKMLLDTHSSMLPAIGLYKKNGFKEVEPYYPNPIENIIYMQVDLRKV